jgi:hypothetical protein
MVDSAQLAGNTWQKMIEVTNHRQIKFMRVPAGWTELSSTAGGVGFQSRRSFGPANNSEVKLCLAYRGLPISEQSSAAFRRILHDHGNIVFINTGATPSESEIALIGSLSEVLGTASNNQVLNRETGWRGACFQLNRAEVLQWNGKALLSVQGWYQDPETATALNEFFGFFYDGDPQAPLCPAEEIFFQAPDSKAYTHYLPELKRALHSIVWN